MPILSASERVGTTLSNKYRLERVLGEGGMGVVFAGTDQRLDRKVAIKFLHAQFARNQEVVRRFFNEAKAAAKLPGDHVVGVIDFDTDPTDGSPYIVLEFLEGESLAERLRRGPMTPAEAWAALSPLMEVLEIAHQQGIIHRDLKPDNVFLSKNWRGQTVPKLLDFGVAKLHEASGTTTGTLVGTPTHMSPEQARSTDIGPWCDVWSMGVIWFEALTGRLHFDFDLTADAISVVLMVVTAKPQKLEKLRPELRGIAEVIDRALEPSRRDRWASMGAFRAALASALNVPSTAPEREPTGPVGTEPVSPGGVSTPAMSLVQPPTITRKVVTTGAVVALACVAVFGAAFLAGRDEPSSAGPSPSAAEVVAPAPPVVAAPAAATPPAPSPPPGRSVPSTPPVRATPVASTQAPSDDAGVAPRAHHAAHEHREPATRDSTTAPRIVTSAPPPPEPARAPTEVVTTPPARESSAPRTRSRSGVVLGGADDL